jgi:acyl carrier protein
MTKEEFLNTLSEVLEEENLTETSSIELTSLQVLSVMMFVDENFGKRLKTNDLKNVKSIPDLISVIGIKLD